MVHGSIAGGVVCDAPDESHLQVHWRSPGQLGALAVGRVFPSLLGGMYLMLYFAWHALLSLLLAFLRFSCLC